uniref:Uncharacterized protein n=1 Tax=Arundo donax TaxID=35708 RepID=A0A0A9EXX7_ARUDO
MRSALGKERDSEDGGGGDAGEEREERTERRELLAERWRLRRDIAVGDRCRDLGIFFPLRG